MENNIHSYDDYPSVLHAEDIQIILRMGRRKTYEFLSDPPFHVNRVGKLIKVSKGVFINWLEGK
ncbi:DNA-binding protein [Paenibacillus tianjinensis]|uniref:DNA-binding protein n=1 Tax=Paenibacillus tianjinensis TaxID=2810347 RepID=A0ABX7LIH5_9BACL|nr:DNA-binding protein [Paenibacillus tianjinensis]